MVQIRELVVQKLCVEGEPIETRQQPQVDPTSHSLTQPLNLSFPTLTIHFL
jgi:hypothetical protein